MQTQEKGAESSQNVMEMGLENFCLSTSFLLHPAGSQCPNIGDTVKKGGYRFLLDATRVIDAQLALHESCPMGKKIKLKSEERNKNNQP